MSEDEEAETIRDKTDDDREDLAFAARSHPHESEPRREKDRDSRDIRLAQKQVRVPALFLILTWGGVALLATIFLYATLSRFPSDARQQGRIDATTARPQPQRGATQKEKVDMLAWEEAGEYIFWACLVALPLCLWGLFSSFQMRRLRGYWSIVATSVILIFLCLPCGVTFPPGIIPPIAALVVLRRPHVQRAFKLVRTQGVRSARHS